MVRRLNHSTIIPLMELLTDLNNYFNTHLLVAAGLGALIGLERELAGKDPSLRTFSLISLGSCTFTMVSSMASAHIPTADPARIAAQIVTGIGFIGAGAIFRSTRGGVSGLTTAALMWVTAAIGMAVGFDRLDIAVSATLLSILMIFGLQFVHKMIRLFRGPDKINPNAESTSVLE